MAGRAHSQTQRTQPIRSPKATSASGLTAPPILASETARRVMGHGGACGASGWACACKASPGAAKVRGVLAGGLAAERGFEQLGGGGGV